MREHAPGRRERCTAPTFTCELPLVATPHDTHILNTRLDHAARQLYNACLGEGLRRARRLRESRVYQAARHLPYREERTAAFKTARDVAGFTDAALQRYAIGIRRRAFDEHLDAHTAQTLATRAFRVANRHLLGRCGRPRFKGARQLDSGESKSNKAGILWRADHVAWKGLVLPAIIAPTDRVIAHALAHRVKYVRLVRRQVRGRDRFFAHLACEGQPYQKPTHPIGRSEIGVDLGPSTIAVVSETTVFLESFCEPIVRQHRQIRRLQRHLDRQRRVNNPQHYCPDGQVKPGRKRWTISHRQQHSLTRLAELHRREAAYRKTLQGQMANRVLAMGKIIKLEKISYRSYQRRFGKSVSLRAPGMFVSILRRKAGSAGGQVIEFPTTETKLSQTCHHCGTVQKKPLSQRTHRCACGVEMQRDLYSAFLARCVGENEVLHVRLARRCWPGAEPLLRAAWSQSTEPASGRLRPSSFGLRPSAVRSQSGSLAAEGIANAEAQDAVALRRESLGEATVVVLRTPGL